MDIRTMKQQNPTNTAEQWNTLNPVLLESEIGFESDTGLFKIGDGVHQWTDLPYSRSATSKITAGDGIRIIDQQIGAKLLYEIIEP